MHNKKINNLSQLAPSERYAYFIRKVADFEQLFLIVNEDRDFITFKVGSEI